MIPGKKDRPRLERVGELFGSPIFEFGGQILDLDISSEPEQDPHILIWLFREDLPSAKFVDAYRQFIDLCYYRNKILSAYRETRRLYRKTYEIYTQLENNVKSFKDSLTQHDESPQLSEKELDRLKEVLKTFSQLDLEYARLLRNYKHSRNTIAINAKNYQVALENILRQLQENNHAVQSSDLDFFRELTDRTLKGSPVSPLGETPRPHWLTSPYFQTRIADELNYFIEGSNLADKAIASIRGRSGNRTNPARRDSSKPRKTSRKYHPSPRNCDRDWGNFRFNRSIDYHPLENSLGQRSVRLSPSLYYWFFWQFFRSDLRLRVGKIMATLKST